MHAGFRPGLGAELGLPAGFTLGVGTNWVGGDVNASTDQTDFNLGLSPYAQARFHIQGDADGRGFQLGTSATYKFVGFEGNPGEIGVGGVGAATRAHLGGRVAGRPRQGLRDHRLRRRGARVRARPSRPRARPGRGRPSAQGDRHRSPARRRTTLVGGGIASLTLGRWQVATLVGASSLGLAQGQAGALGQLMLTARF